MQRGCRDETIGMTNAHRVSPDAVVDQQYRLVRRAPVETALAIGRGLQPRGRL